MYRSEITPELRAIAASAGLTKAQVFTRDRSRPVEVLCR